MTIVLGTSRGWSLPSYFNLTFLTINKSARLVCLATRLLHHLTTKHEKLVDMQEKLSRIHGGSQKYLVCLARLNFMEDDLVLDADIGPEIQECAHEMLELAVTPEEGDAIHSAFSST
jgi:hypothetical protein